MNRRTFVSSVAVAGAALASRSRLLAAAVTRPRVGLIGCGWFGGVNLENFANNTAVDFVSLCDPNQHSLRDTLKTVAKYQQAVPQTFSDYREMLKPGAHDIVIVGTPDHWHALPAIAAMKAGADLYLEKPVSVDVIEGEALVAAARKYNRVVQVNTQRRSNPLYAEARDKYVTSGRIGKIGLVETYSFLGGRPTGLIPDGPVPAHLDYELWTGPAPMLPFKPAKESRGWRAFQEYGNGQIGDLGVHMIDKVRWLLGLGWPQSIQSTGGIYVDPTGTSNITDTQLSVFRYPGLDVSWSHRTWGQSPIPLRHWSDQWGARLVGSKGTLNLTMLEYIFTPTGGGVREGVHMLSKTGNLENIDFDKEGDAYVETEKRHVLDFMAAREKRSRPIADIEEGHISSACCELANLSLQLGRPLVYDPKTRTIPGDAEATRLLARPYRGPWVHPDPAKV
ncbi:MAG TPA: Gfo/Idh/MocA family oxidoreductase [Lacunisphaera sp.]|nr:Gfo/Idh/MocA family oxidoreductase [Lacunisphaera sp.]